MSYIVHFIEMRTERKLECKHTCNYKPLKIYKVYYKIKVLWWK